MTKRPFSSPHHACALALLLAVGAAQAQTQVIPLPLSGPAYQLAQEAFKASSHGDYRLAYARLREAIRLRPDAMELRRQLRATRAQERGGGKGGGVRDAGYADAGAAYRAVAARQFDTALQSARQAVAKSPRNSAYWLLLGNILIETGQYAAAETALADGLAAAGDDVGLQRRQGDLRREVAAAQAALALRAQQDQDVRAELQAAQRAVDYAPDNLNYRLLLAIALLHDEKLQAAEGVADEAHARDEYQTGPLLLRAYARLRRGDEDAAQADFARALALAGDSERANVQLLRAAAEMAMQRPQRALDLLTDVDGNAASQARATARQALVRYRRAALSLRQDPARPLSQREFPVPSLDCSGGGASSAEACRVVPGQLPQDRGFAQAQLAYRAMDDKDYATAAGRAGQAIALAPQNMDYRLLQLNALVAAEQWPDALQSANEALQQGQPGDGPLLAQRGNIREHLGDAQGAQADYRAALAQGDLPLDTQIDLLARTGQAQQAREQFLAGRDAGALDDLDDLQMAYLAQRAGEDGIAQDSFSRVDAAGQLPDGALQDAGYSALRNGDDRSAIGWFKRRIDSIDGLGPAASAADLQQREQTRRTLATVDRSFGVIASLSHNGGGPSAGSAGRPGASGGESTLQAGAEAYWRPFGYMGGRTVEVFGRVFQTLDDQSGGSTGFATAQATFGARWKPFASQNIVVSLGRLVPLGSQSTADWLAQLAWSDGIGTDKRDDRPSWWTTQWYAELGRYFQHPQTYGLASLQAGRSIRLDSIDPDLVLFPHATLNLDYNSLNSHRSAIGAGPGVNLRYWFRGDQYHAPRSYVDLSLQYRLRIGGDARAQGWFVTTTLSY